MGDSHPSPEIIEIAALSCEHLPDNSLVFRVPSGEVLARYAYNDWQILWGDPAHIAGFREGSLLPNGLARHWREV
jgi:hypothetical protein